MIVTEKKPFEEVAESLKDDQKIFILGCGGCPEGANTGGQNEIDTLAQQLKKEGKHITGTMLVDFLCNKTLVGIRVSRKEKLVLSADTVLVISCGIGVQATGAMIPLSVIPALNTISMGGAQGLWPSSERCGECGDCILEVTGGICPITTCAKSLRNGTCGGAHEGKCEIDPDKDCGWYLIYERLKKIGRLDKFMTIQPLRDYKKMEFPMQRKNTIYWALEQEENLEDKQRRIG